MSTHLIGVIAEVKLTLAAGKLELLSIIYAIKRVSDLEANQKLKLIKKIKNYKKRLTTGNNCGIK